YLTKAPPPRLAIPARVRHESGGKTKKGNDTTLPPSLFICIPFSYLTSRTRRAIIATAATEAARGPKP
ncbi:MAG: hypothetical protein J6V07_05040, partial [Clostridia bacterium]|nr:hypothetical protein [Clostridia bacterium]